MTLIPNILSPSYWKRTWADILLVFRLMGERDVPIWLKILPVVVIVYLISPFDLIPGFLPVIGQMDDFGLLVLMLAVFIRLAPDDVVARLRQPPVD